MNNVHYPTDRMIDEMPDINEGLKKGEKPKEVKMIFRFPNYMFPEITGEFKAQALKQIEEDNQ